MLLAHLSGTLAADHCSRHPSHLVLMISKSRLISVACPELMPSSPENFEVHHELMGSLRTSIHQNHTEKRAARTVSSRQPKP